MLLTLWHAAVAFPEEDIHFLSEHAVESGMDAAYMSLPWPAGRLAPGTWRPSVDLATAQTTTDFMRLKGRVVSVSAAHGVSAHWGYQVLASYASMKISGDDGRAPLSSGFLGEVPLDLPQLADFSVPRGSQSHISAGAAAIHERRGTDSAYSSQLIAGLLLERVEITPFRMNYRLASGPDTGASGTLEYRSRASFVTPFVGWQQTRPLSSRWTWSPRAMLVLPLPSRDLDARLTGPGFDVSTPRESPAVPIGDGFFVLGLALRHQPSGLEIDLGGRLYYATGESASHPGVADARALHVAWRPASR